MEETSEHVNDEKVFAPVRRKFSSMIWTFAYFLALYILFHTYTVFSRYTSLRPSFIDAITSVNFFNYPFLFSLLSFSLSVTLVIHKSYLKGLIALAIYPAILLLPNLEGDLGAFVFLSVVIELPILFVFASFAIVIRRFFRLRDTWLKFLLAISPYAILIILFLFTHSNINANIANKGIEYCDSLREVAGTGGSSQKADCYYQVAVKEGDPQICTKISGGVMNTNLQTPCLVDTFRNIDSDNLVIDSKYCKMNFSERYIHECKAAVAIIRNDISLCYDGFCEHMFNKYSSK